MSYPLTAITGVGPEMAKKLKAEAIRTTDELLKAGESAKSRKKLAEKLHIDDRVVLRWVTLADRMRLRGVREPYAELLREAGVNTVNELRYRNPEKLAESMATVNRKCKLVRLLPKVKRVSGWIEQAKGLPPKIKY